MAVTFQMETSRLSRVLREAFKDSKKDMRDFVRPVGGQVAYTAMALTPPTPGPGKGLAVGSQGRVMWNTHKAAGEFAVRRDLRKIFVAIDSLSTKVEGQYRFVGEMGGKRYVVAHERDKTTAGVSELRRIHLSLRNRRGRVRAMRVPYRNLGGNVVEILRFVVDEKTFLDYEREVLDSVGWGKAGWLPAVRRFLHKGAVPAWISKHGGKSGASSGLWNEKSTSTSYEVTFGNMVEHVRSAAESAKVVTSAMGLVANKWERMRRDFLASRIRKFQSAQRRA